MLPPEVCRGDPINPGIPQGPGTLCRPNFCQACCVPFGVIVDECIVTMPPDCLSRGGTPQGKSTQCIAGERQCSTGACCLASQNEAGDVIITCEDDVQSGQCISRSGFFLGHGSSCVAGTCPPGGACCLWLGDCIMTFEDTCNFFNQEDCGPQFFWQGDGTACSEVECPPVAKCCHGFAAQDCDNKTEDECRDLGGVWGSPFERLCCASDPDPCLGACCILDGLLCIETDAPTCVFNNQGVFIGFGTLCEQIECPTEIGACCYSPTGDPFEARVCVETTLDDCINSRLGEFMGVNRPCFDSLCIDVNACCLPFPSCGCNETVTEAECDLQDGTWWPALSCADILTSSCLCPGDPLCIGACCGNPNTVNCHDPEGDPLERPCCRGCICCKAVCLFIDPVCCDPPPPASGWDFICADWANRCCTPTCWDTCPVLVRDVVCQYLGFGPPP